MATCKKRLLVWAVCLFAIFLWHTKSLPGQSIQYGKLTGQVLLPSGEAIPGVNVEISSPALMSGKLTTVTSERGTYFFLNLPIGKYKVTAYLDGFKTVSQKDVTVTAAAVATINLIMETGDINEEILVTASVPVVDVKTSTVDTKIDKEFMQKLPTSRDAFYDLSLTAPGMVDAAKDYTWLPSPSAYGSGSNENAFLVNGVNATDPRGGAWGTLVNVNYNAVEEVRIVALGAKAEYGSATGVAVDVVTKSGSNTLGGNVGYYSQLAKPISNQPEAGEALGRDWLLPPESTIVSKTYTDLEFALTLGGPLIKNKVWFFAGFDYIHNKLKKALFEPLLDTYGPIGDIKLTAEPFMNNRAWVAFHMENTKVMGDTWGDGVPWDGEVQFGRTEKNTTISSQWQWFPTQKTFFSAKYLGFWTQWLPQVPDDAKAWPAYINWWKWKAFGVNGHFPYVEGHNSDRHTIQADVSHYAENFLGEHDIKFGAQYTFGKGDELGGYFTGKANMAYPLRYDAYRDIAYAQSMGDTGMLWYVQEFNIPPTLTGRSFQEIGFFLDDQWTPSNRLTVNIGLRYDNFSNRYTKGKVYQVPATPNDINDPNLPVVRERSGTNNIFDMSSWSPRLGLTYTLTKDNKTVVRANYGRYYMPIGLENLSRFGPDMPLNRLHWLYYNIPFDIVDANHNGYIDDDEVIAAAKLLHDWIPYDESWEETDPSWICKVAPGTKQQYNDQLTFNIERELMKDLSLSFTAIYKNTGNMLVNWPINKVTGEAYEYEFFPWTTPFGQQVNLYSIVWRDYNGDGVIDGEDIRWIDENTSYMVRNMPDDINAKRRYTGLQLVLNKRYSHRWQALASLLYSDSNGIANRLGAQDWNVEGTEIMDHSFISSMNELINNLEGPLPFTPKFELKVSGSYTIPKLEVDVGLRYRFNTGRAYWWIIPIPVKTADSPETDGVITTGGGNIIGIDPKHPKYLPTQNIFDFHLERSINLGKRKNVILSFDCFNLFNSKTPTNAVFNEADGTLGTVTAIVTPSRKLKFGITFEF